MSRSELGRASGASTKMNPTLRVAPEGNKPRAGGDIEEHFTVLWKNC